MTQGVETPTRFVLLVEWESLEAHQAFRGLRPVRDLAWGYR